MVGACSTAASPRTVTIDTPPRSAAIDSIFAEFDRPGSPGCAVGVYRAGEVLFARGYGMASIEHAAPITSRTPFVVGSVAKHFTGFAVHLLARQGRLSLDDDIRRHLPEVPELGATVAVRHLLHHTSGFRAYEDLLSLEGWNRDHPLSREQALATVAAHRTLGFPPGERYQYANTNYVLLAEIVERASGLPFGEFMAREVFAPLGMTNSTVRTDPLAIVSGRAEHYWPGREPGDFRRNHIWAFAHATGASNVVTSLEDLARWDANFYDERVGGPGISARMYEAGVLRSGDRIGGLGSYRGLSMYARGGGGGGDYSVVRFPQQRLSVAVLCNLGLGADAHGRALRVAGFYLPEMIASAPAKETSDAVALTEETLRGFVGEYHNPQNHEQRVRIDVRDGALGFTQPGSDFQPAVAVGPRTFRSGPVTFEFSMSVPGAPDRVTYEVGGQRGTLVRREAPALRAPELAGYVGAYRSEELDATWKVALRGDSLVLRRPRLAERVLVPIDQDAFRWDEPFEDETLEVGLTFTRSPDGRVEGVRVQTDRVSNLQFARVEDPR